ncbi:MAG TPA: peroxiredoxin, partial [Thermoanaerobaculia bacterium]|nr:peroxiredoxin [Thermoanaerobaculia bacterium]
QKIPAFELPDQDGKARTVGDLAGPKGLVLYAYPKDDTPGCTIEAQDFRDVLPELRELGFEVAGISRDPANSHCRFIDKYGLTFPLLTDESASFLEGIGAFGEKTMYGRTTKGILRTTVVVDPEGRVLRAYPNVRAKGHAERVVADLKEA